MADPLSSDLKTPATLRQLAAFLGARRGQLMDVWMAALRQNRCADHTPAADDRGLIDHLPRLFDDLVASLRGEPAAREQIQQDAKTHGQVRWDQNYPLGEVLRELGIVSRLLLEHGFDAFANAHTELDRETLRPARESILSFFEDTACGSARQYVFRQQEDLRAADQAARREERRAAAVVQGDYDRLADMFQASPSFLAILRGPEHVFHLANDQYERITGHRPLLGKPVREALPEVVEQGYVELLDRVYATGQPYVGNDVRILLQSEPGAPPKDHFIDFVYLPTRTADGTIDGIVVHGVDWTERKQAQQTAGELSEQRRLALDSARMGWWHFDPAARLVTWDERSQELYGQSVIQLAYDEFLPLIHPDDQAARNAAFQTAMLPESALPQYETEYRVRRADGTWRWLQIRGKATFAGEGMERRILSMDGTVADVTVAKEAQAALRQSEEQFRRLADSERAARTEAERVGRMKDEFLATLSHELRTPLNAILGWAQVLRGDPANTEDMEAGLATIERNSRAQTQIIEDLLDMSKIVSGKIRLNVERLDLAAIIEGAVETARPAATAKGIRLHVTIDPQVSTVSGDSARLQQVFWNLLSNATKFTPKGGSVEVGLERIHSHLEVSVVDSGEGIAAEFLPEVFDKFRQQDASTTRKHGGLGLGLAIVKQLVELHGGSVRVESAGKAQGATFVVTLPLAVLQPVAIPPSDEPDPRDRLEGASALSIPAELLRLEGVKVLVVDDEPDARALVKRLLEDRGARVTVAGSVAEAMERFRAERPDVLVSDIGMPEEDGYALIRRVRALGTEQGGSTPAIALTAYARAEDRLKAIMAGFQIHTTKPIDATELLALVATLAGRGGSS